MTSLQTALGEFVRIAKNFPSNKALRDYLSEHPNADANAHKVVRSPGRLDKIKDPHDRAEAWLEKQREQRKEESKAKRKEKKLKKDEDAKANPEPSKDESKKEASSLKSALDSFQHVVAKQATRPLP
jgi:hypothetical protein